jgi:Secretion system C-terminal sorting domain
MKNILTIFIFFIVGNINAQIINIPDANFKAKLLSANSSNAVARDVNYVSIIIDTNGNNEIEVSEALVVNYLYIYNSNISSIDGIQFFTNLDTLVCNNNGLLSIDVTALINLTALFCGNNQLTTLNLNNNNLNNLNFSNNYINNFNSSALPALQFINGDFNNITTLDFSNNYNLVQGNFKNNNLQSINFKNGNPFNIAAGSEMYQNNPNLQFICVNDDFVNSMQLIIDTTTGVPSNVIVTSYCSFTPGGTYYTIQGNTKYDQANNGCDVSDINYANLKINLTDGTNSGTVIANGSGTYSLPVSAGTHTITPVLENPSYFTISPSTTSVTFPATASPYTQNYCISPNGVHNDLLVELIPITSARAGYDSQYKIKYKNKGTQTQSGTLNFTFQNTVQDVVATNPSPTTSVLNTLSWSFTNLLPFETREISIVLNVNSSVETPAVNSGDVLAFSSSIVGLTDETPTDNSVEVNQIVVNSFDPNDKTCLEGTTISPTKIGDYVHYMIRFENSGTANAQNVVVKDIIDSAKFEISTLQFVDSSHPCITKISNGNRVEFIFEGINLSFTDATNDGYIVFKIKSKNTLVVGDQITNNANIYFDYNAPIATNTATSTYQALNNVDFDFGNYFTLSPVPAKDFLNITSKKQVEINSISVYNILGQLVQTFINPSNELDVSTLKSGNYILKMTTENGILNTKFSKQ